MAPRSIDVVAAGPPVDDPYDPAGFAWAIAEGFASAGDSVQVVYPGAVGSDETATPVPSVALQTPGASVGSVELTRLAARAIRPEAQFVIRDPLGFGPLGVGHGSRGARIVGVVRASERTFLGEGVPSDRKAGFLGRIEAWNARRARRKLGRGAVEESYRLFADDPGLGPILEREYGIDPERALPTPPPIPRGGPAPTRSEARRAITVPDDVPVVVMVAPPSSAPLASVAQVREAFVGVRPIFPGVRLVAVGVNGVSGPGISSFPRRDLTTFVTALAGADLAVFPGPSASIDAGLVLGLRAGVPVVTLPGTRVPAEFAPAVRAVPSGDPRDLASTITELLADPSGRAELARPGPSLAARFDAASVARELVGT
jgi:hypothetical protein